MILMWEDCEDNSVFNLKICNPISIDSFASYVFYATHTEFVIPSHNSQMIDFGFFDIN